MMDYKWRSFLINEVIKLPKQVYTELEEQLVSSRWWELPNDAEDVSKKATPLSLAMQDALTTGLKNSGLDISVKTEIIKGSYIEPDDENVMAYAEHYGYHKGSEFIKIYLYIGNTNEIDSFDPRKATKEIAEVVRHELIHSGQLTKQAIKKGINRQKAEKQRQKDPKQIYQGRDQEKYFSLHNEIDAFAHQIAEELIRRYGSDALDTISMSMDNPALPAEVKEFAPLKILKDPKARKKLKSRIYSYLQELADMN